MDQYAPSGFGKAIARRVPGPEFFRRGSRRSSPLKFELNLANSHFINQIRGLAAKPLKRATIPFEGGHLTGAKLPPSAARRRAGSAVSLGSGDGLRLCRLDRTGVSPAVCGEGPPATK